MELVYVKGLLTSHGEELSAEDIILLDKYIMKEDEEVAVSKSQIALPLGT